MTRRGKVLLIVGLLLALLITLAICFAANRTQNQPSSNARFVAGREVSMKDKTHVQLPLSSAQGNGGTHRPEREVFYKEATAPEHRGRTQGEEM